MTITSNARAADARRTLAFIGIPIGADFHALPSIQVESLLECARLERYRQPKNANGSRARYYHERLQRLAAREGK